jgi:hypothetical protein
MTKGRYLPPWLLQVAGLLLIMGGAIFWAITGHQSALIVGAGLSLAALGAYSGLHVTVEKELEPNEEGGRRGGK